ncbi:MAG TPA: hypothetical protein VH306_14870 [Gaiellaceae bacterium]|jgi:hypothetical protein
MAKAKSEEILRKQKEAKQKKLLFVLAPILLLLLVWQGPGYLKMLKGSDTAATTTTESTSADTTASPTPDPSTSPAPSTATPGAPAAPGATPASNGGVLQDSDQPPSAETGQLISFDRFVGRDPFKQGVSDAEDTGATAPPTTPVTPPSSGGGDGGGSGGGGAVAAKPVSAVLETNGVKQTVAPNGAFPKSDQIFRLTKLTKTSAFIGLVGGQFSNGKSSLELKLGKTLTLVSQPDGVRYTIKLVSIQRA